MTVKRYLMPAVLLPLAAGLAGCNILAFPAYVLFGGGKQTVKAEYTGLSDGRVAVIVAGPPGIEVEYPAARTNISMALLGQLNANIEDLAYVDPQRVEAFRRESSNWNALRLQQIGEALEAQRILYIDLIRYTTADADSVNLLRGHIVADVRVYEIDGPHPERAAYQAEIETMFPEGTPYIYSAANQRGIELRTIALFAVEASRKFYDYKIERTKKN